MTHPTPLPAVELDAIGYSKRILALVDDYTDRPNKDTRAAIRAQLLSDFDGLLTALTAAQARAEAVENLLQEAPIYFAPQHDFEGRKAAWLERMRAATTDSAIGGKGAR